MTVLSSIDALDPSWRARAGDDGQIMATRNTTSHEVTTVSGMDDAAMRFSGQSYLTVQNEPDFTRNRTLTYFAWVRATRGNTTRYVIGRRNGGTRVEMGVAGDGRAFFEAASTRGSHNLITTGGKRIDDSSWHLLVGAMQPRRRGLISDSDEFIMDLYVDGERVKQSHLSLGMFSISPNFSMRTDVYVGRAPDASSGFVGDMQVVGYFNRYLFESDARALWNNGSVASGPGMGWGVLMG